MIKDRLGDLKNVRRNENAEVPAETSPDLVDGGEKLEEDFVEVELTNSHRTSFADAIIKRYAEVIKDFEEINASLEILKTMLEARNAHKFDEDEFNKIRQKNSQLSNSLVNKFKKLESKLPKQTDYRTKARMQRALYYGYFQQYVQLWSKHEEVLQKYEQQLKKNLQVQSKILNYDLTDEEIDTLIANKQTNLLMDNILTDTETARQQLQAIQDRLSDLLKLEKSISEVHGLFMRLQTLVVEQGDVMQRIENHFNDAREYTAEGLEQIKLAKILHEKRCGLRRILIIVGVVVLLLSLLFIINSIHCFMFCKKKK